MAKKNTNRLPAITAPYPSKKRPAQSKLSPTASVYHFLGDNSFRVFWTDQDGNTLLQHANKAKPYFPQTKLEMDRLLNFGRIVPVSEMPIADWLSNKESTKISPENNNIYLKGTLYE